MTAPGPRLLADILGQTETIRIVDIGASPMGHPPPYSALLARGRAEIIGFDPNPDALRKLNESKSPNETYLPHAIGDGAEWPLHICAFDGMTSLLEPNKEVLALFSGFPQWGEVTRIDRVATTRLDDVAGIGAPDCIKIDVQGAELMVLENAPRCLSSCVVVQTEAEFLPMYRGQPLFSDIERFLRSSGFMLHKLWEPHQRALVPLIVNGDMLTNYGQLFWSDAIFVRDLTRLDALTDLQIVKLATIAHDMYQAYDLALLVLTALDRRSGSRNADRLLTALAG